MLVRVGERISVHIAAGCRGALRRSCEVYFSNWQGHGSQPTNGARGHKGGDSNTVNRAPRVETFAEELLEGLDMRGGEGGGSHDAWSRAGELEESVSRDYMSGSRGW